MYYSTEVKEAAKRLFLRRHKAKEIQAQLNLPNTRIVYYWIRQGMWEDMLTDEEPLTAVSRRITLLMEKTDTLAKGELDELDELDRLITMRERLAKQCAKPAPLPAGEPIEDGGHPRDEQRGERKSRGGRGGKGEKKPKPVKNDVSGLAYLCRLRGIEVVTLTDANELESGILTNRRKGSRDNIVRWTPRLRKAWDHAKAYRAKVWAKRKTAIPIAPSRRNIIVASHGGPLRKSSLDTAWQRFITLALADEIITPEQRFALHDLKRRGITDTVGTRADKQEASGHRDPKMMDVYDHSVPVVSPSAE